MVLLFPTVTLFESRQKKYKFFIRKNLIKTSRVRLIDFVELWLDLNLLTRDAGTFWPLALLSTSFVQTYWSAHRVPVCPLLFSTGLNSHLQLLLPAIGFKPLTEFYAHINAAYQVIIARNGLERIPTETRCYSTIQIRWSVTVRCAVAKIVMCWRVKPISPRYCYYRRVSHS
jgi:hypothetical protein